MAKILIVEDEFNLQAALSKKLEENNHTVISAADGEAGVQAALSEKPDLILLDIVLPKLSGIDVLEKLRQDPAGKELNVVMLTNLEEPEKIERATELGAKGYLIKSNYELEEIFKKIEAYL